MARISKSAKTTLINGQPMGYVLSTWYHPLQDFWKCYYYGEAEVDQTRLYCCIATEYKIVPLKQFNGWPLCNPPSTKLILLYLCFTTHLTDNALPNSHMFNVRFVFMVVFFLSVKRANARQKTMTSSEITFCVYKVHNGILLYFKVQNLTSPVWVSFFNKNVYAFFLSLLKKMSNKVWNVHGIISNHKYKLYIPHAW